VLVGHPPSRVLPLFHRHESTAITFYFDGSWSEAAPYAEIPIEYPPAAWLFIRAVSAADWSTFVDRFRWTSAAFEAAAFLLFLSIVRRHWPHRFWLMAASYVLCTTALEQLLYENLDAGLLLLLMGWIWLRVAPRSHATAASLASHGVLGLAIAFGSACRSCCSRHPGLAAFALQLPREALRSCCLAAHCRS
jgi:hypothetical protein